MNNMIAKVRATPPRRLGTLVSFRLVVQILCGHLKAVGLVLHLAIPTLLQELVGKVLGVCSSCVFLCRVETIHIVVHIVSLLHYSCSSRKFHFLLSGVFVFTILECAGEQAASNIATSLTMVFIGTSGWRISVGKQERTSILLTNHSL